LLCSKERIDHVMKNHVIMMVCFSSCHVMPHSEVLWFADLESVLCPIGFWEIVPRTFF